uniref:Uncharacterized protein n=1 Tax=Rhinolophus ferrumequinum TaxID=59479 RepID=A0A671EFM2_RHIFE
MPATEGVGESAQSNEPGQPERLPSSRTPGTLAAEGSKVAQAEAVVFALDDGFLTLGLPKYI